MDKARKINTTYYNKNAERWSAIKTNSFYHEQGFRKFIALLKPKDSVIDIGCAYGIHVPLFLGIGNFLKYSGFDISKKMIQLAVSRYPQHNFFVADILEKKSLPHKKYSGFWAGAVLMHIPEEQWDQMLINIKTIIKPKGIGYFSLPNMRPNEASSEDQRHFSIINSKKLRSFMSKHGWKIIKKGDFPVDPRAIWSWYIVQLP